MGYWPDLFWKVFFIIKNIFIIKNLTDFRKTVEASVDPRLCLQCFQSSFRENISKELDNLSRKLEAISARVDSLDAAIDDLLKYHELSV